MYAGLIERRARPLSHLAIGQKRDRFLHYLAPQEQVVVDGQLIDQRKVLMGTQAAFMVTAALLAGLTLTGHATVWEVYVLAGITGLMTAVLLSRAGKNVLVLEARTVGACATGNTTAIKQLIRPA